MLREPECLSHKKWVQMEPSPSQPTPQYLPPEGTLPGLLTLAFLPISTRAQAWLFITKVVWAMVFVSFLSVLGALGIGWPVWPYIVLAFFVLLLAAVVAVTDPFPPESKKGK